MRDGQASGRVRVACPRFCSVSQCLLLRSRAGASHPFPTASLTIAFHASPRPLHDSYGIARSLGEVRIAIVRGSVKRLKRRTIADRPECAGRLTLDLTILVGCKEPD